MGSGHISDQISLDEFECLFNVTLTVEVISWRGRPDNVVAVGFDPKKTPVRIMFAHVM